MEYILYMQSLSGGGVEGQWEQCATPGLAPISLDQLAWGLRWDPHVHPVHGNSYSPPKSVAKHNDIHISYLKVFRHAHTEHTDTYMQNRHDSDIYSQLPEPEPTGNSVYTSSSTELRQVGLECKVSGDTWSHCHSQRMARAFSKLNLEYVY